MKNSDYHKFFNMNDKTYNNLFQLIIGTLKGRSKSLEVFNSMVSQKEIPTKTVLLKEGEIASNIYFIREGCLRQWFNKDGKDVSFQFFFENQSVASIESFWYVKPSLFTIESIEPSKILYINRVY